MLAFFRRPKAADGRFRIPRESLLVVQAESEGLPDIHVVNQALDAVAGSPVLRWHLSIIIGLEEHHENGLPTPAEQEVLSALIAEFRRRLEADDNAALLASVTWNGTRQVVFRVRDPERANAYLTTVVEAPSPKRPLDYRMEDDPTWALAESYLRPGRGGA